MVLAVIFGWVLNKLFRGHDRTNTLLGVILAAVVSAILGRLSMGEWTTPLVACLPAGMIMLFWGYFGYLPGSSASK